MEKNCCSKKLSLTENAFLVVAILISRFLSLSLFFKGKGGLNWYGEGEGSLIDGSRSFEGGKMNGGGRISFQRGGLEENELYPTNTQHVEPDMLWHFHWDTFCAVPERFPITWWCVMHRLLRWPRAGLPDHASWCPRRRITCPAMFALCGASKLLSQPTTYS